MTSCAYQDCFNVAKPCSKLVFFKLPTDPAKRKLWIENSGNPQLKNLTENARRLFCEKHFDQKYLRRQFNRTTLHPMAVLKKYGETEIEPEISVGVASSQESVLTEVSDTVGVIGEKNDESDTVLVVSVDKSTGLVETPPVILNKCFNMQSSNESPTNNDSPKPAFYSNARKRRLDATNDDDSPLKPKRILKKAELVDGCFVFRPITNTNDFVQEKGETKETKINDSNDNMTEVNAIATRVQTKDQSVQMSVDYKDSASQTDPETKSVGTSKETLKIKDEDSYFCVNVIAEAMKRLSPEKKAKAKLHMISYLFELEHS